MNKKNTLKYIFVLFLVIFVSIYIIILNYYNFSCNEEKVEKNIVWDSMSPMISDWDNIRFLKNYYLACWKQIKKWDVILYNYLWWKQKLIKIIKITPKDNLEIFWNRIIINWKIMKNSVWQEYVFSDWEIKLISIYIKDWKIPENSYMIFWDNIYSSTDSRKFWAISINDILWKFDIIKK